MSSLYSEVDLVIVDKDSCYKVTVPGSNERDGIKFLESIGSGSLGSGMRITQLGSSIPRIRTEYETRLKNLVNEAKSRNGTMPISELARWASDERTKIARAMRRRQGPVSTAVLEVRDWGKYGIGGRRWNNIYARVVKKPGDPDAGILKGAMRPNEEISEAAIRGARLLRTSGTVFFVVGLGISVSKIIMAEPGRRAEVMKREAVDAGGGALGAEAGVGLCLVFGIASGGWGLLACGLVGGAAGGWATESIVYPAHPDFALRELQHTGKLVNTHLFVSPHQVIR